MFDREQLHKAVLALWREFAWNSTGSPKTGFELDADDILKSRETALEAIRHQQEAQMDLPQVR